MRSTRYFWLPDTGTRALLRLCFVYTLRHSPFNCCTRRSLVSCLHRSKVTPVLERQSMVPSACSRPETFHCSIEKIMLYPFHAQTEWRSNFCQVWNQVLDDIAQADESLYFHKTCRWFKSLNDIFSVICKFWTPWADHGAQIMRVLSEELIFPKFESGSSAIYIIKIDFWTSLKCNWEVILNPRISLSFLRANCHLALD